MLAAWRRRLGLSQAELAARAHMSPSSLKAYESGRRHPSRPYLSALLDVLKVDRLERGRILDAAGYASDAYDVGPWGGKTFMFTPEEAAAYCEGLAWPAFVSDELMTVVSANSLAQRLWGVDLDREMPDPIDRNLLSVASSRRFADRVLNLPEVLNVMAAVMKGHHRGAEVLDHPSPYFAAVLERFLAGDPKYIEPFLKAFQQATPRTPKVRWGFPVIWSDPALGTLRFSGIISPASEPAGLAFNDWFPVDAGTWDALEALRRQDGPLNGRR